MALEPFRWSPLRGIQLIHTAQRLIAGRRIEQVVIQIDRTTIERQCSEAVSTTKCYDRSAAISSQCNEPRGNGSSPGAKEGKWSLAF